MLQFHKILFLNTLAFTVCFSCWTLNGVLVTFLVDKDIFHWTVIEVGWLFGIPILSGSIFRLPIGIFTDKFGGKIVFSALLLLCSIPLFMLPFADTFWSFAVLSFLFGLVGTSFADGIGKAVVFKHIPEYFPNEVVVGGMVGFVGPIIFGYLLNSTGLWTSSLIFIFVISALCLLWMHRTIINILRVKSPSLRKT